MENKLKTREVLNNTSYNPKYIVLNENNKDEVVGFFPCVVKYIDSNGSKDVYLCRDKNEYKQNVDKLFLKYPNGKVLAEEFLDGPQYIVETVVINKKVQIIAIIAQEIECFNNHFIITGYNLYYDYQDSFYHSLKSAVEDILKVLKFEMGPCHFEIRLVNNQWKLIEINPRISGAGMNQFLMIGLGINVVKETIKLSLNIKCNFEARFYRHTFAKYIVLDQEGKLVRISGKTKATSSPGVEFIYVKPHKGSILSTPQSMGNRYAYVIATGWTNEEAKINANEAASKITFHLEN